MMIGIKAENIGYAGLKDEDGITFQYISIYKQKVADFTKQEKPECWFKLSFEGTGKHPIKIGKLNGNFFDVIVRNLPTPFGEVSTQVIQKLKFVNYYDVQRFGLCGFEKLAHKVGESLINMDYDSALFLSWKGGNTSDHEFLSYKSNAKKYWEQNDIRQNNFFLNAFDSYKWNMQVTSMLSANNSSYILFKEEPFSFVFAGHIPLEANESKMSIMRHRYNSKGEITVSSRLRDVFVETLISVSPYMPDQYFPDKTCIQLSFSLPPGCYATMLIRQWIKSIQQGRRK